MNSFEQEYKTKRDLIESYIKADFSNNDASYQKVIDASFYAVEGKGKRIRPVMMMAAYELFRSDTQAILPFCAAMEYIHNYSLIHDDLPAMDNDDLRRGRPTCHKVYGEATAILAGDALLTKAFEKMAFANHENGQAVAYIIAKAAGSDGMIGGQTIDVENEGRKIPLKLLNELHALKTGALIRASFMAGAVLGGADEKTAALLGEFGSMTGLAFQIKDDMLDVTSDVETLGKPIGSDAKNEKTTYLTYFSLEECEDIIKDLSLKCCEIADKFGEKGRFLKELTEYLLNRIN